MLLDFSALSCYTSALEAPRRSKMHNTIRAPRAPVRTGGVGGRRARAGARVESRLFELKIELYTR